MQTEIVPLCLRIMKNGQALSKTVATFIIQKILCDEKGLSYICATVERFFAVSTVLNSMLKELIDNNKEDHRLSKHIMKCYSRLSENMQYLYVYKGHARFWTKIYLLIWKIRRKICWTRKEKKVIILWWRIWTSMRESDESAKNSVDRSIDLLCCAF